MTEEQIIYQEIKDDLILAASNYGGDIFTHIIIPAMFDIIGTVENKDILDIQCGAGFMSRKLSSMGARVTAIDSSQRYIEIASELNIRENERIHYAVADTTDLSLLGETLFDDVVSNLGINMVQDISISIGEIARFIKMGGRFIFSVLHPCFVVPDSYWLADSINSRKNKVTSSYFEECWWRPDIDIAYREIDKKVKHRTLSRIINTLSSRGFQIRRISEPKPSKEQIASNPHLEVFSRIPLVMIIEAIFPYC
ncbi:MAG: class I SAM-dependent methyltransferase [Armatimonadota bacterium]